MALGINSSSVIIKHTDHVVSVHGKITQVCPIKILQKRGYDTSRLPIMSAGNKIEAYQLLSHINTGIVDYHHIMN